MMVVSSGLSLAGSGACVSGLAFGNEIDDFQNRKAVKDRQIQTNAEGCV